MLKNVISIFLLAIMLLGNVGFTYGTHFCMGMAMKSEMMLGHEYMDCGMGTMDTPAHESTDTHFSAPDCSENQYISIEIEDSFKKSNSLDLAPIFVAAPISHVLYAIEQPIGDSPVWVADTSPPLLKQDFTVLHQVFRI